ncbi:integral membrane protein S linking to the trans Golgi network-domain-containing protein, partial [Spinellus fusiger]
MTPSSFRTTTWDPLLIIAQVKAIRIDTVSGWTLALVWCIHAVLAIPVLVLVLQRAKLVLDFVVTMHGLHLVIVFMYRHTLPTSGLWWLLQIIHCLIMTLGGEWACMQQEMKPIFI